MKPILAFLSADSTHASTEVKKAMEGYKLKDGLVY